MTMYVFQNSKKIMKLISEQIILPTYLLITIFFNIKLNKYSQVHWNSNTHDVIFKQNSDFSIESL